MLSAQLSDCCDWRRPCVRRLPRFAAALEGPRAALLRADALLDAPRALEPDRPFVAPDFAAPRPAAFEAARLELVFEPALEPVLEAPLLADRVASDDPPDDPLEDPPLALLAERPFEDVERGVRAIVLPPTGCRGS